MTATLDRSQPYGEVIGLLGVRYEQGGHYFNPRGAEVGQNGHPLETSSPISVHGSPEAKSNGLEGKHWRELKALVETFGGEWSNKAGAIAFLRGRSA